MAYIDYLNQNFYGNTIIDYLIFFAFISSAVILGKVIYYITTTIIKKFTARTKTQLDDILIDMLEEPLVFFIVVLGFYFGYHSLSLAENIAALCDKIFHVLVTVAIVWFITRLLDSLIVHYVTPLTKKTKSDLDDHLVPIIRRLIKIVIFSITAIMILDNLGYNVTSVLAGLGIGGLAFALAAKDMLANLFGGLSIILDKPFKLGELVDIAGQQGEVVEIGMRSTRLKTASGDYITIPNSFIAEKGVTNFKRYDERSFTLTLGLVYSTTNIQMKKAKEIVIRNLLNQKSIDKESVECNFTNFGASSLDIEARYKINLNDARAVRKIKDTVYCEIKEQFEKEGIEFAYPTQTVFVKK